VRLFAERPGVFDTVASLPVTRGRGVIELDGVSFAYPDRPRVLADVSLRLEPGRLTVLTGASGVGKSTILNLIVRLFDPSSGEVRLDGVPLPAITLRSLRSQMAVLSQDTHIFSGTLRGALTPPGRECSDDVLREALTLVSLEKFVDLLPDGLDTAIGEDAVNLSGGQRRRLALARAFLLDRPILLLDEPLANIDAESAGVVLHALARLRQTRTCLAVTHDAALVALADRRYHLRHGRIEPARSMRRLAAVEA
jgi:ABC-type multidrug transport system fused ATPase/permease subunit